MQDCEQCAQLGRLRLGRLRFGRSGLFAAWATTCIFAPYAISGLVREGPLWLWHHAAFEGLSAALNFLLLREIHRAWVHWRHEPGPRLRYWWAVLGRCLLLVLGWAAAVALFMTGSP